MLQKYNTQRADWEIKTTYFIMVLYSLIFRLIKSLLVTPVSYESNILFIFVQIHTIKYHVLGHNIKVQVRMFNDDYTVLNPICNSSVNEDAMPMCCKTKAIYNHGLITSKKQKSICQLLEGHVSNEGKMGRADGHLSQHGQVRLKGQFSCCITLGSPETIM